MKKLKPGMLIDGPRTVRPMLIAAFIVELLLPHKAGATSICRWIDENGQTQFSDIVPDKYKSDVTCIQSQILELSPEQRAAKERSKHRVDNIEPPAQAKSKPPPIADTGPVTATKRPAEVVTEKTDCKTWRRLYDESGACFAPFRTSRGGMKAEAFDSCNEIPNPEETCGPKSN